jgi:hypothetical protein
MQDSGASQTARGVIQLVHRYLSSFWMEVCLYYTLI